MSQIEKLYNEWQSLQPLKSQDQKRLDEKFRLEFNYNSNHIEGNTLTYGQTKLLLIFDKTEGIHELRNFEEMKAHDVALKMIVEEAKDKERPLTESFIRTLNEKILVRPFWKDAETFDGQKTRVEIKIGEYKSRPNHVRTASGEIFHYATEAETPAMMKDLVDWFNAESTKSALSPIELAALLHYRYIRIHPFEDGNGRIARLLVNYVLLRFDYPMIIIQTKDKNNYLGALNLCDVESGLEPAQGAYSKIDKIKPFVNYLTNQLIWSLEISIKAAKGEDIEEDDDFEKKLSLLERKLKEDEITKPGFKVEYAEEIIKKVVIPLNKELDEMIQKLSGFFSFKELSCVISNGGTSEKILSPFYIDFDNDDIKDFVSSVKSIQIRINLSNNQNRKLQNLYFQSFIYVVFDGDEYRIELNDKKKTFKYTELPTTAELKEMVNECKNRVIDKIKNL
jgi:fido (protein-threonine AMPylation protein)